MKRWLRKLTITQLLHRARKENIGKEERKRGLDAVFPHEALCLLIMDSGFTTNVPFVGCEYLEQFSDRTYCF